MEEEASTCGWVGFLRPTSLKEVAIGNPYGRHLAL